MNQMQIVWDVDKAQPFADCQIMDAVKEGIGRFLAGDELYQVCPISQNMMLDAFRVCVKEGLIKKDQIIFLIDGKVIRIDQNGNLEHYPACLDEAMNLQMKLLGWS
jgi:hypothetical protein